jgi:hypothetical protein
MKENRSFVITLVLATMSGALIGLLAFGVTGKGAQPAPAAIASPDVNATAAPSAPSPSTPAPETMAPVQYDDSNVDSAPAPTPRGKDPADLPVLN